MANHDGQSDARPVAPGWIRLVAFMQPSSGVILVAVAVILPLQFFFGNPGWNDAQNLTRTILLSVLGVLALIFWLLGKTPSSKRHRLLHSTDESPRTE